jgi:hypothetical protein
LSAAVAVGIAATTASSMNSPQGWIRRMTSPRPAFPRRAKSGLSDKRLSLPAWRGLCQQKTGV